MEHPDPYTIPAHLYPYGGKRGMVVNLNSAKMLR
jgi:hypothetical protein